MIARWIDCTSNLFSWLMAAVSALIIVIGSATMAQEVPPHLSGLAVQLFSQIGDDDFADYEGSALKAEVLRAIEDGQLRDIPRSRPSMEVDLAQMARALQLDPSKEESLELLKALVAAPDDAARRAVIEDRLPEASDEADLMIARLRERLDTDAGEIARRARIPLADGRSVEVTWDPGSGAVQVAVEHGGNRGRTVLHGTAEMDMGDDGRVTASNVAPSEAPVSYLSEDFQNQVGETVFGIWGWSGRRVLIRPVDPNLDPPDLRDLPRNASAANELQARIDALKGRKVYIWRAPGGGEVIQNEFQDLRHLGDYEFLRGESETYFDDQIAALESQLAEIEADTDTNRGDSYDRFDPLGMASTENADRPRTPVRLSYIQADGVRATYDAFFDGRRIAGFRRVEDIRQINRELPEPIRQALVSDVETPNWTEFRPVFDPQTGIVEMRVTDFWPRVWWNGGRDDARFDRLGDIYNNRGIARRLADGDDTAVALQVVDLEGNAVWGIDDSQPVMLEAEFLVSREDAPDAGLYYPELPEISTEDVAGEDTDTDADEPVRASEPAEVTPEAIAGDGEEGETAEESAAASLRMAPMLGDDGLPDPHIFRSQPFYLRSVQFSERPLGDGLYNETRYVDPDRVGRLRNEFERNIAAGAEAARALAGDWIIAHQEGGNGFVGRATASDDGKTIRMAVTDETGFKRFQAYEVRGIGDQIEVRFERVNAFSPERDAASALIPLPEARLIDAPTLQPEAEFRLFEATHKVAVDLKPAPLEVFNVLLSPRDEERFSGALRYEFPSGSRGRQTWSRNAEVAAAVVIEEQIDPRGQSGMGLVSDVVGAFTTHYPHRKITSVTELPNLGDRPSASDAAEHARLRAELRTQSFATRQRTIFIWGKNLPRGIGDLAIIQSQTPGLTYSAVTDGLLDNQILDTGWSRAEAIKKEAINRDDFDVMVLRARFDESVKPGFHVGVLNGMPFRWFLTFPDATARYYFVSTPPLEGQPTNVGYAGQMVQIEMALAADLPVEDDLVLELRAENSDFAAPEVYEVAMHRVTYAEIGDDRATGPLDRPLYRSEPIHIVNAGDYTTQPPEGFPGLVVTVNRPEASTPRDEEAADDAREPVTDEPAADAPPPPDFGPASKPENILSTEYDAGTALGQLQVFWKNPALIRVPRPVGLTVYPSPSDILLRNEPQTTWVQAMARARGCYPGSGQLISASNVNEHSRFIITEVVSSRGRERGARRLANPQNLQEAIENAFAPGIVFLTEAGTRRVDVTLGDHAAALLVRDEFILRSREREAFFRRVAEGGEQNWVNYSLENGPESDPFWEVAKLRVTEATNVLSVALDFYFESRGQIQLGELLDLEALPEKYEEARLFGARPFFEKYLRIAAKQYADAIKASVDKTIEAGDCNMERLLIVSTRGSAALINPILPRLMTIEAQGESLLWVPDMNARNRVRSLTSLRTEVQALDGYATMDKTFVAMTVAGGAGFGSAILAQTGRVAAGAYLMLAADTLDIIVFGSYGIYEQYEKWGEVDFGRGASATLGTAAYFDAVRGDPSLFWTFAGVALPGLGVAGSLGDIANVARIARGRALVDEVGDITADALRALPEADQRALHAFMEQTRQLRLLQNTPGWRGVRDQTFRLNRISLEEGDLLRLEKFEAYGRARRVEIDEGFFASRKLDEITDAEVLRLTPDERARFALYVEEIEVRIAALANSKPSGRIALVSARERQIAEAFGGRMPELEATAARMRQLAAADAAAARRTANQLDAPDPDDARNSLPPRDPDTDAPREPDTGTPRDPETEAPRDPDTDAPRDGETETSRDPETETPRDPEIETPRDPETETPRNSDTGAPRDPDTNAPRNPGSDAPRDPQTDTPRDPDTPREPDPDAPRDPDADGTGDPGPEPETPVAETPRAPEAETPRQPDPDGEFRTAESDLPRQPDADTPRNPGGEAPRADDPGAPRTEPDGEPRTAEADAPRSDPDDGPGPARDPPDEDETVEAVPDAQFPDGGTTLSLRTADGEVTPPVTLGRELGRGGTHRVYEIEGMPCCVARIPNAEAEATTGLPWDRFGRRALEEIDDPAVRIAIRERNEFVTSGPFAGRRVEIVERIPEDAATQIRNNPQGTLTPGQAIALDKATRAMNRRGLVWADNRTENFAFEAVEGARDDWTVVVLDSGGIFRMRGDETVSAAQRARAFQAEHAQDLNFIADRLRLAEANTDDNFRTLRNSINIADRDARLRNYADNFDQDDMLGAGRWTEETLASMPFRVDGTMFLPKYNELSQLGPEAAEAAYGILRNDPLAGAGVSFDRLDAVRDTLRTEGFAALDGMRADERIAVSDAMAAVARKAGNDGLDSLTANERLLADLADDLAPDAAANWRAWDGTSPEDGIRPRNPLDQDNPRPQIRAALSEATERALRARLGRAVSQLSDNAEIASPEIRRAMKEAADDLSFREGVLRQISDAEREVVTAARQNRSGPQVDAFRRQVDLTTQADLEWLSGRRPRLSDAEVGRAMAQLDANERLWAKMLKDPKLSPGEVHRMTNWRKSWVDNALAEEIARVRQEGTPIDPLAFGSNNLTSDYDLSIKVARGEPGAATVIRNFNQRFRDEFGMEPGLVFDTNVYSEPAYTFFRAPGADAARPENALRQDAVRQLLFRETAMRRYASDAEWDAHRSRLLDGASPDEATALNYVFREVENNFTAVTANQRARQARLLGGAAARDAMETRQADLSALRADLDDAGKAELALLDRQLDQARLRAANETYADTLASVEDFAAEHNRLSGLDLSDPAAIAALDPAGRPLTRMGGGVETAHGRRLAGLRDQAEALADARARGAPTEELLQSIEDSRTATLAALNEQARSRQGQALFFASEAYQTDGAIAHVVGELQAGGRKITAQSLRGPRVESALSADQYFDSFGENRANMLKEIGQIRDPNTNLLRYPEKGAAKASKYMIRQLDAGHQGGIDLPDVLPDDGIIDLVVEVERNRGDLLKVAAVLRQNNVSADDFVNAVVDASNRISVETARRGQLNRDAAEIADYLRASDAELDDFLAAGLPNPQRRVETLAGTERANATLAGLDGTDRARAFEALDAADQDAVLAALESARAQRQAGRNLTDAEQALITEAKRLTEDLARSNEAWRQTDRPRPFSSAEIDDPARGKALADQMLDEVSERLAAARRAVAVANDPSSVIQARRAELVETANDLEFRQDVLSNIAGRFESEFAARAAVEGASTKLAEARQTGNAEAIAAAEDVRRNAARAEIDARTGRRAVTESDLDWLSGNRGRLTAAETEAASTLMDRNGGRWTSLLRDAAVGPAEMHRMTVHRRTVVNDMLRRISEDVANRTGRDPEAMAFGSESLTSDYDLSIRIAEGPGAAEVVRRFNEEFRAKYGVESGVYFDTNVYTDPSFNWARRTDTTANGALDVAAGESDRVVQAALRETKIRRFASDEEWARHRELSLEGLDGSDKRAMEIILNRAEANHATAGAALDGRAEDLLVAGGSDTVQLRQALSAAREAEDISEVDRLAGILENARLQASNEIYSNLLDEIDATRALFENALNPAIANSGARVRALADQVAGLPEALRAPARRRIDAATEAIARAEALEAAGGPGNRTQALIARAEAGVELNEMTAELARFARNQQGEALYYASEAYFTEGAIKHVVGELQAGGRKVTVESLGSAPVASDTTRGEYLDSFYENRGDMIKEIGHYVIDGRLTEPARAAGKLSKYLIRQLDAAHQAGLDLTVLSDPRLIELTVGLNARRGTTANVSTYLQEQGVTGDQFLAMARQASRELTRQAVRGSELMERAAEIAAGTENAVLGLR